jgi:hypothetical protein
VLVFAINLALTFLLGRSIVAANSPGEYAAALAEPVKTQWV